MLFSYVNPHCFSGNDEIVSTIDLNNQVLILRYGNPCLVICFPVIECYCYVSLLLTRYLYIAAISCDIALIFLIGLMRNPEQTGADNRLKPSLKRIEVASSSFLVLFTELRLLAGFYVD